MKTNYSRPGLLIAVALISLATVSSVFAGRGGSTVIVKKEIKPIGSSQ